MSLHRGFAFPPAIPAYPPSDGDGASVSSAFTGNAPSVFGGTAPRERLVRRGAGADDGATGCGKAIG